jgi:hypothetical protein
MQHSDPEDVARYDVGPAGCQRRVVAAARGMGASRNGNHGVVEISQWVDKRLMEAKELPDDTSDADAP